MLNDPRIFILSDRLIVLFFESHRGRVQGRLFLRQKDEAGPRERKDEKGHFSYHRDHIRALLRKSGTYLLTPMVRTQRTIGKEDLRSQFHPHHAVCIIYVHRNNSYYTSFQQEYESSKSQQWAYFLMYFSLSFSYT